MPSDPTPPRPSVARLFEMIAKMTRVIVKMEGDARAALERRRPRGDVPQSSSRRRAGERPDS